MIYFLISLTCVVSIILYNAGNKAIKNPKGYQYMDQSIHVGFSTKLDEQKDIDEKTWYYGQYIYGKAMKVLSIINIFLIMPEIFFLFNTSQEISSIEESTIMLCLFFFVIIPIFIYRILATLYTKSKVKNHDPDDFNTFNEIYDIQKKERKQKEIEETNQDIELENEEKTIEQYEIDCEEVEKLINKQQVQYNKYSTSYDKKKHLITKEQLNFIQDSLNQIEGYNQLIHQYHTCTFTLDNILKIGKTIFNDYGAYSYARKNNFIESLLTFGDRHYNNHYVPDYLDSGYMEEVIIGQKKKILIHYKQYKNELIKIDELHTKYHLENNPLNDHLYEIKDQETPLFLTKGKIEDLLAYCKEAKVSILKEQLDCYHKRNTLYEEILELIA